MITLPDSPAPSGVQITPVDAGFVQQGASGPAGRVDRPGNHYAVELEFPPMTPEVARKFTVRMAVAKRDGLRVEIPLLGVSQGVPGSPLVNGAGQTGTALIVDGLTPGYVVKEGYWLHIVDAAGQRYAHQVTAAVVANGSGQATLALEPPLRAAFADNAVIELAHPTIEGAVMEAVGWSLSVDRLVRFGARVVIEEAA